MIAIQQTYDRNSMLNNLSQGLSLGLAGDEDGVFPSPAAVAVELLAGLAVGEAAICALCFNGDCEAFLDFGAEYIGLLSKDCGLTAESFCAVALLSEASADGTGSPPCFASSAGFSLSPRLHGPRRRSRLTTSNTCASSLSVWLASVGRRTILGTLA